MGVNVRVGTGVRVKVGVEVGTGVRLAVAVGVMGVEVGVMGVDVGVIGVDVGVIGVDVGATGVGVRLVSVGLTGAVAGAVELAELAVLGSAGSGMSAEVPAAVSLLGPATGLPAAFAGD